MENPSCPLTDEHCAIATRGLQLCADYRCYDQMIRQLGVTLDEELAHVENKERWFADLKRLFFPNAT